MEKLFDKIGDHFNNPEMSDRILVVKIRKDGWEKLEAAWRVRSITKTNSQGGNDDSLSTTNNNQQEKPQNSVENESVVSIVEQNFNDESPPTTADDSSSLSLPSISDSRTVSSLSCDSGIGDALSSETKRTVKSKKREESWIVVEDQEQESGTTMNSDTCKLQASGTSSDVDLDVTFSKLLIADIRYAHKAGEIGLTAANTAEDGASASFSSQSTENGIKTSEEDLTLADTVIREHQLYVHSFWLALNSSYFRSLFFSSGMKETKVKKV